jgi:hypothetical protein
MESLDPANRASVNGSFNKPGAIEAGTAPRKTSGGPRPIGLSHHFRLRRILGLWEESKGWSLFNAACPDFLVACLYQLRGHIRRRLASVERADREWSGRRSNSSNALEPDRERPLVGEVTRLGNQFACGLRRPVVRHFPSGRGRKEIATNTVPKSRHGQRIMEE